MPSHAPTSLSHNINKTLYICLVIDINSLPCKKYKFNLYEHANIYNLLSNIHKCPAFTKTTINPNRSNNKVLSNTRSIHTISNIKYASNTKNTWRDFAMLRLDCFCSFFTSSSASCDRPPLSVCAPPHTPSLQPFCLIHLTSKHINQSLRQSRINRGIRASRAAKWLMSLTCDCEDEGSNPTSGIL